MTEQETALKKENLQLRMQLAEVQSQLLQHAHNQWAVELKALTSEPPSESSCPSTP